MTLVCESGSQSSCSGSESHVSKEISEETRSCSTESLSDDDSNTSADISYTSTNSKKRRKQRSAFKHKRRSRRGNSSISHLAEAIISNKNVLFITGAGLSASCGIRPFRGKNGLWSEVVMRCVTHE